MAKRRRIDAGIDMTPLIDVVFQLLIFLMVSSQFTKPDAVVELPQAGRNAPKVDPRRDKISVAVEADGTIVVNGKTITREELPAAIEEAAAKLDEKRVEFRGDHDAAYGIFVEIMEIAREKGVASFGVVKKNEPENE
ncbi:MAG: biopolymer transporter ExbD [Verrucomicrobiota bacterium]